MSDLDDNMTGTLLLEQAKQTYPYLKQSNLGITYTPNARSPYQSEYWPKEEGGTQERPRPSALPLAQSGLQVFNRTVRPMDILGEYVSHEAINTDPRLQEMYGRFREQVPEETMRQRYGTHQQKFDEQRPFELWKEQTGLPEYFRGYTFNQWPNAQNHYTPDQLKTLDEIRAYLGIEP